MRDYDPSGTIAMFIAAALQHPNPPCNGRRRRMSTISVGQHKNKFDQVVVYCDLADENLVSEAWAADGHDGEPSDEFVGKCMLHDAQVYRGAYRKMLFLAPQYRDMTLARPDFGHLLHDDVQGAYDWLDDAVKRAKEPGAHENHGFYLNRQLRQWRVATVAELREKLQKVYKYEW